MKGCCIDLETIPPEYWWPLINLLESETGGMRGLDGILQYGLKRYLIIIKYVASGKVGVVSSSDPSSVYPLVKIN